MATFDQALTEAALIAIPILIFLLGVGWFKYLGGNGAKSPSPGREDPPKRNTNETPAGNTNNPNNTNNGQNPPNPNGTGKPNNSTKDNQSTPNPNANRNNSNSDTGGNFSGTTPDTPDPNGGSGGDGSDGGGGGNNGGGGGSNGGPNGGGSNGGGPDGGGSNGGGSGEGGLPAGMDSDGNARPGWVRVVHPDGKHVFMIKHDPANPIDVNVTMTPTGVGEDGGPTNFAGITPPGSAIPAYSSRQVETPIAPQGFRPPPIDTNGQRGRADHDSVGQQQRGMPIGGPPPSAYPWGYSGSMSKPLVQQEAQDTRAKESVKNPIPIPADQANVARPDGIFPSPTQVVPDRVPNKDEPKVSFADLQNSAEVSPDYRRSNERIVLSPQHNTDQPKRQKKPTHYQNEAGEWIRIPPSPRAEAPTVQRKRSVDSMHTQDGARRAKGRPRSVSEPQSPSGKPLKLLSPEAAKALFADEITLDKAKARPLTEQALQDRPLRFNESLIDEWDDGAIYDIKDIQRARSSSPPVRKKKVQVDPETVEITLGDSIKADQAVKTEVEKPRFIRVRGKDGKVVLVNPADLGQKASPEVAQAKAPTEEKADNVAAKTAEEQPQTELSKDKELESISKELAKINGEAEKKTEASGQADTEGDKQSQPDKAQRLQDLRDQLNKIKSNKEEESWKKLDAELAKAQQRSEPPKAEGRESRTEEDGLESGLRSPVRRRRGREEVMRSPELSQDLTDTGLRRRRSVRVEDGDSVASPDYAPSRPGGRNYETGEISSRPTDARSQKPPIRDRRMDSLEENPSDRGDDYESRASDRRVRGERPSERSATSRTRRQPVQTEDEDHRPVRIEASEVSRRDFAERDAKTDIASSARLEGATYDYYPLGTAATAPQLDAADRKAHADLQQLGDVKPSDSVSTAGETQGSRRSNDGAHHRRNAHNPAAEDNRSEMPAAMSDVGKKTKDTLVADLTTSKDSELNVSDLDVTQLKAEIQKFVLKIKMDIARGFKDDIEIHNAWLDETLTEAEEIRTRVNSLPKAKIQECDTMLHESDTLLKEQIEICHATYQPPDVQLERQSPDPELKNKLSGDKLPPVASTKGAKSEQFKVSNSDTSDDDDDVDDLDSLSQSQADKNLSGGDDKSSRIGSSKKSADAGKEHVMPENAHHRGRNASLRSGSFAPLNIKKNGRSTEPPSERTPDSPSLSESEGEDLYEDRTPALQKAKQRETKSKNPHGADDLVSEKESYIEATKLDRPAVRNKDARSEIAKVEPAGRERAKKPVPNGRDNSGPHQTGAQQSDPEDLYDNYGASGHAEYQHVQDYEDMQGDDDLQLPAKSSHVGRKDSLKDSRPAFSDPKPEAKTSTRPDISGKPQVADHDDGFNQPNFDDVGSDGRDVKQQAKTGRPSSPKFRSVNYDNPDPAVKQSMPDMSNYQQEESSRPILAAPVLVPPVRGDPALARGSSGSRRLEDLIPREKGAEGRSGIKSRDGDLSRNPTASNHIGKSRSPLKSPLSSPDDQNVEKPSGSAMSVYPPEWIQLWRERSSACKRAFSRKELPPRANSQRHTLYRRMTRTTPEADWPTVVKEYEALTAHFNKLSPAKHMSVYFMHEEEAFWMLSLDEWNAKVGSSVAAVVKADQDTSNGAVAELNSAGREYRDVDKWLKEVDEFHNDVRQQTAVGFASHRDHTSWLSGLQKRAELLRYGHGDLNPKIQPLHLRSMEAVEAQYEVERKMWKKAQAVHNKKMEDMDIDKQPPTGLSDGNMKVDTSESAPNVNDDPKTNKPSHQEYPMSPDTAQKSTGDRHGVAQPTDMNRVGKKRPDPALSPVSVFRAEVVLDKDVSRPDLSLNDEIFNLQWKVLWKARSKVCRERFNTPLKVDTNTAVKRAESQSLISPGDHEGASAAYQELTVLLSKVVLPPSDKARRALGKIALIAPDTVSWERQLASVISGSKTREAAERKMDGRDRSRPGGTEEGATSRRDQDMVQNRKDERHEAKSSDSERDSSATNQSADELSGNTEQVDSDGKRVDQDEVATPTLPTAPQNRSSNKEGLQGSGNESPVSDEDDDSVGVPDKARHVKKKKTQEKNKKENNDNSEEPDAPSRRGTYPPPASGKGPTASKQSKKPALPSLFDVRPVVSGLWQYTKNAKLLCLILIIQCAISVLGVRQITALVSLPSGGATDSSSIAKRASGDDLPIDIRYTQKWLDKMFGGTPDPILVLTLMFTWVSMCILMSGVIYNAIIEKTENTMETSKTDTKDKWYNNKKLVVKRIWVWMKSCFIGAVRLLLMDRHPSIKHFYSKLGLRTGLRILLFVVQLLIAILMVRQVLAMASLVAGAETPIPSNLEIPYTLSILKNAMPFMQKFPSGVMLLVVSVLTGVLIILPVGWHSLLHPRPKNPNSRSAKQTIFRIFTCRAFGSGIRLGKFYGPVVGLLCLFVVISFAACLEYFVEIMAYVGDVDFVKDAGYVDSIGLIGAFVIFGVFALPLGWIALKTGDLCKSMLSKLTAGKPAKST